MNLGLTMRFADKEITGKCKTTFQGMLPKQNRAKLTVHLGIAQIDINESKSHPSGDPRINADHALTGLAIVSAELEQFQHGTSGVE